MHIYIQTDRHTHMHVYIYVYIFIRICIENLNRRLIHHDLGELVECDEMVAVLIGVRNHLLDALGRKVHLLQVGRAPNRLRQKRCE